MKTIMLLIGFFIVGSPILIAQNESKELNQASLLMQFIGNWKIEIDENSIEYVDLKPIENENGLDVYAKWVDDEDKIFLEAYGFWGYDKEIDKIDVSIILSDGSVVHCLGSFKSKDEFEFYEWSKQYPKIKIRKYHFTLKSDDYLYETVTDLATNTEDEYHWIRIK